MRATVPALAISLIMVTLPVLSGCTYTCHKYEGFQEAISSDGWKIEGSIIRYYAEDRVPTKYSKDHWGSRNDDRYWLIMVPVPSDSGFWNVGEVELAEVWIVAGVDTISITWDERINVNKDEIIIYPHWENDYKGASNRFISECFHLSRPVPDSLMVEYEFIVLDKTTKNPISQWKLRSRAGIDRHRRWLLIDAAES